MLDAALSVVPGRKERRCERGSERTHRTHQDTHTHKQRQTDRTNGETGQANKANRQIAMPQLWHCLVPNQAAKKEQDRVNAGFFGCGRGDRARRT